MKVREVITLNHWTNGSGWSHSECYGDQIVDITPERLAGEMDWGWWDTGETTEGDDCEIKVTVYALDEDGGELLKTWRTWVSDLLEEV